MKKIIAIFAILCSCLVFSIPATAKPKPIGDSICGNCGDGGGPPGNLCNKYTVGFDYYYSPDGGAHYYTYRCYDVYSGNPSSPDAYVWYRL